MVKVSRTFVAGIGCRFILRWGRMIKDVLVAPKNRYTITKKNGVIYRYKCARVESDDEYIGEC